MPNRHRTFATALLLAAGSAAAQVPVVTVQQTGTTSLLQAVSVSELHPEVVWISGHKGTYVLTTDGGVTWTARVMHGRDSLEFRDVHALDARRAWLLSSGAGAKSGIFRTADGGVSWAQVFVNRDTAAFYDCMAFFDESHAFAFSDAVGGRMPIARTGNGRDWSVGRVPVQEGEGGFAASGTCAQASAAGDAWIGTGAAARPRVLHSIDRGQSWSAADVPIVSGKASGVAALAFRDRRHGVALGGVIAGSETGPRAARTDDGGATWTVISDPPFAGAVYGAAYGVARGRAILIAVGPGGAAWSADHGDTWAQLDAASYWSVGWGANGVAWLAGPRGRVARIDWR